MKSVLISVQPKWCELIASGKKTVEVRKTRPKVDTPFKVYIYCTQGKPTLGRCLKDNSLKATDETDFDNYNRDTLFRANGKVIGEFVCDAIYDCRDVNMDDTCLTVDEWLKYTQGHKGVVYGWHISDLVIYDKPKDLSEFHPHCNHADYCTECKNYDFDTKDCRRIKRPPHSWCYVERSEG